MKLTVQRREVSEGLHVVGRGVSGRSTLPILSNVMLEVSGERLRLLATDLEMWVECAIEVKEAEEGAVTVPARVLGDLVDRFAEGPLTMELGAEGGPLAVSSGKARYEIQCLPAQEFPAAPQIVNGSAITMSQENLRRLIRSVIFAASADETRAVLTGALLRCEKDSLMLVATDMHRLAVNSAPASVKGEAAQAVVPSRALGEAARALAAEGDAEITLGEGQIRFDLGRVCVVSRLVEGQFPDYKRVIPEQAEQRLVVNREEILTAVRRAAVFARAEANKVVLKAKDGVLAIRAESADVGKGSDEVAVQLDNGEIEIAFNAEYLIDVLGVLEAESVEIGLSGPLSPGTVRPVDGDSFTYVVMPMAIL